MGCGCGGGRRRNFSRRAPVTPRGVRKRGGRTPAEAAALVNLMSRKKASQSSLVKNRRLVERKKRLAIAKRILGN